MRTVKDVEAYLEKSNRSYSPVDGEDGTFLVRSSEAFPPLAVRVDPPLVVVRVHIGDIAEERTALFRKLLELNARSLVHASYGIEGNRIVLTSAHELENLDFNEMEAMLDEIDVALAQQIPELAELSKQRASS